LLLEDLSAMAVGNQVRGINAMACGQVLEAMAAMDLAFLIGDRPGHRCLISLCQLIAPDRLRTDSGMQGTGCL
jgi:hypothetical protein